MPQRIIITDRSTNRAIEQAIPKLMKDLGYNKGYRYSHSYDNSYSYQNYFPETLEGKTYYTPSRFGFEREIIKRLDWWQKQKKQQEDTNTGKR